MVESSARWSYCLIRWVPNPARGEFVNVGAVVFNEHDEAGLLVELGDFERANRLGQTLPELAEVIETLLTPLRAAAPGSRISEVEQINHDHQNLVQFTHAIPMSVGSGEEALSLIMKWQVSDA